MTRDLFNLKGKVALITGANDGIGQAIAVALAEAGADIVAAHRSDISTTERMVRETGREFHSVKTDLSRMDSVAPLVSEALGRFGKIDILVNNAGAIIRRDTVDFTEEEWDQVMNINTKVLFFLTQAVARQMIDKGIRGRIINIASLLSFQGGIRVASYTASKFSVRGLTMLMTNEWAGHGITVNAIAPGYIATKMTKALRDDEARSKALMERIPVGRFGTPEDFKGPALLLASDAGAYISGHTLVVDGGWLAR